MPISARVHDIYPRKLDDGIQPPKELCGVEPGACKGSSPIKADIQLNYACPGSDHTFFPHLDYRTMGRYREKSSASLTRVGNSARPSVTLCASNQPQYEPSRHFFVSNANPLHPILAVFKLPNELNLSIVSHSPQTRGSPTIMDGSGLGGVGGSIITVGSWWSFYDR